MTFVDPRLTGMQNTGIGLWVYALSSHLTGYNLFSAKLLFHHSDRTRRQPHAARFSRHEAAFQALTSATEDEFKRSGMPALCLIVENTNSKAYLLRQRKGRHHVAP